jgi:hypothetical protein
MGCINRRKVTGTGVVLALVLLAVGLFSKPSRPQIVGTIAPVDLEEILRLVRRELRSQLLPSLEWYSFQHPGYSTARIKDYYSQHILWAEVHDDGSVDVYAGVSKDVIRDEGHVWTFRKDQNWGSTGYAYWASADVAPAGIHVPPPP